MKRPSKKNSTDPEYPTETCVMCQVVGQVGPDVIVTGDGHWVHHGACHSTLVEKGVPVEPTEELKW